MDDLPRDRAALSIHRCLFVDWVPEAITSLEFSPSRSHLAVGRANGDIELWEVENWRVAAVLPGFGVESQSRSMVWIPCSVTQTVPAPIEGRLFAAGLNGDVVEWDLKTLRPKV